jgi:hypothetical protein
VIRNLLNRVFRMEEINGNNVCPTYLYRWPLLRAGSYFAVYLHKFVGNDWSIDLHDHPKRFVSIGLRGSYVEISPIDPSNPLYCRTREYRAPWVRTFPADHKHRLIGPTPERPCWTLVIVLRATRQWGFWPRGSFVPWRKYVGASDVASRRSCP